VTVLTNITGAEVRDAAPLLEGEIVSRPALLKTDGVNLTYAADVKLPGYDDPLRTVPVAVSATEVLYAEPGAAVTLSRTSGGKFEITGYAKRKPGSRTRIAVDVETLQVGARADVGLSTRVLTLGELGDAAFGAGFGYVPLGAYALFRGSTLLAVRT
jgi:hypothetical protein